MRSIVFIVLLLLAVGTRVVHAQASFCEGVSSENYAECVRAEIVCENEPPAHASKCFNDLKAKYPESAGAQSNPDATNTDTGDQQLNAWLQRIIDLLSALVGIVVVISVIIAGIMYMTARDNASQISAAKQRLVMAITALFLFAFAYAILQWLVPGGIFS